MRPITAADLMNPEVLTVREDWPVADLARFLIDNEISGAPVEAADGQLVGVVSLRDIVAYASGEDEPELDGGDDEAEEAADDTYSEFYAQGWDDDEWTQQDIDDLDLGDEELLVEDIMTPSVFSVSAEATVSEVANLMLNQHLHRVLVLTDGKPVGIISSSDLLGLLVDEA
ncbi:MAG TPA: CBS domain-containing protein [Thermoanaerobaculia bacterium]|nr:CBS domain-containing protein [Thermoanaerobaculia bacterium]